ncbi:glycine cleavage system aminomethyltransferase GcvT [Sphingomonas sp. RG327]|uniref:aminomethyltransferase n=1 Tax=Sphingomonas anseongensis TaxID=2908207 RepID=A0ABT0REA2_9SPHN|nr:glycine cleavage system aminomethyltransferase GcvT [Sphingomonas anseongensis]MCL6678573.1 glycine cleavage system aminomethyltransferase GcvT [Sphingomonas anseongensis]
MSREVHNGPTDQHEQARGTPYTGAAEGEPQPEPQTLPLDSWHRSKGGRMVEFAGYMMPVQYEGIMAEHLWTRENAGLFDVSHMGQLLIHGPDAESALETILPGDIRGLADRKLRYSLLLDGGGGIIDDLMATRRGSDFYLVVNGATKHGDIEVMRQSLPKDLFVDHMTGQALVALQGPKAVDVLEAIIPGVSDLTFMEGNAFHAFGHPLWISRSGYTGEDGFEISIPAVAVEQLAEALVADERVKPIGLGARDSLRLEAGLPLYGHDLDRDTTPVMAGLTFAIQKRRRAEGGFPGAPRILAELEQGAPQKRVGLDVEGRQPVREGALILDGEGSEIGRVTSGGFSPSLQRPIAMGYVATALAEPGTELKLEQRGKLFDSKIAPMPFVPHRYHRKGA